MEKKYDVFGLGNVLMDFLIKVEDEHLNNLDLKKGVMHLLEEGKTHDLLKEFKEHKIVPAGTVPNTLMGIAVLGGNCILLGKVGPGKYGDLFEETMTKEGVKPRLLRSKTARTGKVLNFVTPDAERTFGVHLGAATRVEKDSVIDEDIKSSRLFYFTGYEFESFYKTVIHSIKVSKDNDTMVALDLADPEIINRNKEQIDQIIKDIDILFMNETEAKAYTGLEPKEAAISVGEKVKTVIVKTGEQGSFVVDDKKFYEISPIKAEAVDTTGAGDLYASGFLYGILNGKTVAEAGELGSFMGAKAVSQMGALLNEEAKKEINEFLSEIKS